MKGEVFFDSPDACVVSLAYNVFDMLISFYLFAFIVSPFRISSRRVFCPSR